MLRAIARQAEVERERRAKVINAEGEFQSAAKLAEASSIIENHPVALQLRYLQTMREMAAESNSTTFLPLPIELFKPFLHTREVEQRQEGVNLDHSKIMLGQQFNRGAAMITGCRRHRPHSSTGRN